MTIFAIIADDTTGPEGTLADAIRASFAGAFYQLPNNQWLISATVTAREISDRVGITDGRRGAGVVVEVASYYGRADPAVWTWIKASWEGRAVG